LERPGLSTEKEETVRRIAIGVAGVVLLAIAALAAGLGQAQAQAGISLPLTPSQERSVPLIRGKPGVPGRTWAYWGRFTSPDTPTTRGESGSYRATCIWLANVAWKTNPAKRDPRLSCTLVLSFRACTRTGGAFARNGGTLVLHGLVKRPKKGVGLLAGKSPRLLAIAGGTGAFDGALGSAALTGSPHYLAISAYPGASFTPCVKT
jgi:hypothetical protein